MVKSKFDDGKLQEILEQFLDKSKLYDYRTKDYPFEVICTKFGDEEDINVTLYVPNYQRKFVWDIKKQSKYIESVLLGVPLTPFLVSEDKNSRLEIIDGSQRIRTLIAFFKGRLILRKLKKLTQINSSKFKDLPVKLQNYLKNRDFRVIVVEDAGLQIRQDIFERINTTSLKLTDAEIRKGSNSGKFYNLILELKDNPDFRGICPVSAQKEKRGEYEELLLRFFAYCDKYLEFKHEVAIFLNEYLDDMNKSEIDLSQYRNDFKSMVSFISKYFPLGFRKESRSNSTPRVRFEALAVGVYLALEKNPDLSNPDLSWITSDAFKKQITTDASNNPNRLKNRVEFVRDQLLSESSLD